MNSISILKVIIGLIAYSLLYLLLSKLSEGWFEQAHLFAFSVVILFSLLFNRFFNNSYSTNPQARFQFKRNKQYQLLESLIQSLVGSIRYQEVKKLLFGTFEKLLSRKAHAFYLWDSGLYYLSHYANVENNNELPITIEPSFFNNIPANQHHFNIDTDGVLTEDKRNNLKNIKLTEVYIFSGHNKVFAFLLTTPDAKKLLNREPIKSTFQRVQKKAGLALENTGLYLDLEKKNFETKKLIEISQKVLSSLDIHDILDFILDALGSLIKYDAAVIFLLDDSGRILRSTSSRGYEGTNQEILKLKVGPGSAAGFVVQTKQIDVIQNVKNAVHYCPARKETVSQIAVPFLFDGNVLGVITVESDQEEFFTYNEIELIKMFANLVAVAIYNARQVEIRLAKKALEMELINAATVQKGLLIRRFPRIKNLSYIAENIPSKIVSGDLFDFQKINENALAVAIGDVAGKGAPAALMMTLVLAGFRSQHKKETGTSYVVNHMNDLLTQTTIEGKFTTFFYGIIRTDKDKIIYTNAGHNPPILIKANGDVHYLKTGGIVLGFLDKQTYKQGEITFNKGDIFIAFTDGVTETMDRDENEFGENRIIETICKHQDKSVHEIKRILSESLRSFSNSRSNSDDLTIILAKHE